MFDRVWLKENAKARLSQDRWMAVLVAFVAGAIINFASNLSCEYNSPSFVQAHEHMTEEQFTAYLITQIAMLLLVLLVSLLSIALTLCVTNIVTVGYQGWFLQYSRGDNPRFSVLFSGFKHYRSSFAAMGLRTLFISLWTLLFIIPGLIKSYSYYLVPYILNDNPNISGRDAVRLSKDMMYGWKWELFVLHVSFIGWSILSICTCGLLNIFFLTPYIQTSNAMMYDTIKNDAVYNRHIVDPSVLNMPESDY